MIQKVTIPHLTIHNNTGASILVLGQEIPSGNSFELQFTGASFAAQISDGNIYIMGEDGAFLKKGEDYLFAPGDQ